MKKCVLLILIFSLALSLLPLSLVSAEGSLPTPYDLATSYAEAFPQRDILSDGEAKAATYLAEYLSALGYATDKVTLRYYDQDALTNKQVVYDYSHVIGKMDKKKEKSILIGCYYGGFEPATNSNVGSGASAALSVGILQAVAREMATLSCEYNIVIAFWGGMEISGDFDITKCGVKLEDLALYINLDSVAAGDFDYLYADDVPRAQEKYFRAITEKCGVTLLAPPAYKKGGALFLGDGSYNYTHLGLLGINRFFLNEDIPCVSFLGGNWDDDCGLYRYAGKKEIEGTALDTFKEINLLNGGEDKTRIRLSAVESVITTGLTSDGLTAALQEAAEETSGADLDSALAYYLITFIAMGLLLAFFFVLILKQGKDRREQVWEDAFEKDPPSDPFEELRSDDPAPTSPARRSPDLPDPPSDGDDDVFRF